MKLKNLFFLFYTLLIFGQNINLNNDFNNQLIRYHILTNKIDTELSFNVRPLNFNSFSDLIRNQYKTVLSNNSKTIQIKTLGIDYFLEYNSHHPYNRNNGTMIPNRGYQHIISPGIFLKAGPLTIQFKPEHHFSQNKEFDGLNSFHFEQNLRLRLEIVCSEQSDSEIENDEALDKWLLSVVGTQHHSSGTCKMGPDGDELAVVDKAGSVRGIDGLRVVDASIMPDVVRANTNATVIMIAEKIASEIMG